MQFVFVGSALCVFYYLLLKLQKHLVTFAQFFLYVGLFGMTFSLWEIYGSFSLLAWMPLPLRLFIGGCLALLLAGFILFLFVCYQQTHQAMPCQPQVVFIFGAGLIEDRLSRSLKARLDKGLEIADSHTIFIVSGGQGKNEWQSEASAMGDYLEANGICKCQIVKEDQSTTTYENLAYAKTLFDFGDLPTALVTNQFHLFRAVRMARKMGICGFGVSAPIHHLACGVFYVREYLAVIKAFLYRQIV